MTSVSPRLPFLPFDPSTRGGGELRSDPRETGEFALSFEQLLADAAHAKAIPLNASFAETGTLGFEVEQTPTPALELDGSLHFGISPPPALILRQDTRSPEAAQPDVVSTTVDAHVDGGRVRTSANEYPPAMAGRLRAGAHAQPAPTAGWLPNQLAVITMDEPPAPVDASRRAGVEDALASLGTNVSVALELLGDALRVHVHLPACSELERQRLIGRARDMLRDRGLVQAELIIHERASNRGALSSQRESVRGA